MATWKKTQFSGVFFRSHPTRKHGLKFDQYFAITYRMDGKKKWEKIGWASDGNTAAEAKDLLDEIMKNRTKGEGAHTLREKRAKKKAADEVKAALELEEARKAITFSSFWDSHYWPLQSNKSKGAKEAETGLYNHWIKPAIGDKRFSDIGEMDLQRIKAAMLKAGRAPASIKYAFSVISQVWTLAGGANYVSTPSPTKSKNVRPPKFDNKRMRYLSTDEANLLLAELNKRSPQSHDMAIFALFAGMRFGEIASLTWHDIDLGRETISIRNPKSKKNRHAYITKKMREVLERKAAKDSKGLIFKDENGERVGRISNVYRKVADALFNEGVADHLQRVGFHTLRHTFASWLAEDGKSLYSIKELMGHEDFEMTQRYSHLSPEGLREDAKSLESKLDEAPSNLRTINQSSKAGE